jgi:hypothetical protein
MALSTLVAPPAVVLELSTWLTGVPAELTERIRQALEMLG